MNSRALSAKSTTSTSRELLEGTSPPSSSSSMAGTDKVVEGPNMESRSPALPCESRDGGTESRGRLVGRTAHREDGRQTVSQSRRTQKPRTSLLKLGVRAAGGQAENPGAPQSA